MKSQMLNHTTSQAWDDEIAQNCAMFFEADRLDAQAYKIIESYRGDAATWVRFSDAKKVADTQRALAYREWLRINRAMHGLGTEDDEGSPAAEQ